MSKVFYCFLEFLKELRRYSEWCLALSLQSKNIDVLVNRDSKLPCGVSVRVNGLGVCIHVCIPRLWPISTRFKQIPETLAWYEVG